MTSGSSNKPVVVIGDGWAALGAVGFLATSGRDVRWIAGTGARILAPLPTLEASDAENGVPAWKALAQRMGVEAGESQTGSFLREFRNKAFREPIWTKAPTPENRAEVREESLWAPERRLAQVFEARFALTLGEIEEKIRARLTGEEEIGTLAGIVRTEGIPVAEIKVADDQVQAVVLGSGEEIACDQVIFADRWSSLPTIQGLPKPIAFARKREPMGALQAVFSHEVPMAAGVTEGFFAALHKEAGEEIEKHVFGYFFSDGSKSVWTLCLTPEEAEDNHLIAKKLRRTKTALDRMFTGTSWLPEGKADFLSTLSADGGEQVRFHEAVIFGDGEAPREPLHLKGFDGIAFVTDGYGPSSALKQVGALFPEALAEIENAAASSSGQEPDAQAEGVDLTDPVSS